MNIYLKKRGVKGPWELSPIPTEKFQNIVINPAYAESQHIGQTLDSLSQCEVDSFDNIMVVVVAMMLDIIKSYGMQIPIVVGYTL